MYKVYIERYAQKQIGKLDKKAIPVIKTAIARLAENPRPHGCIKLKGENAYRIRTGKYRIIYEINDAIILVTVVSVGHRKSMYK